MCVQNIESREEGRKKVHRNKNAIIMDDGKNGRFIRGEIRK